MSCQRFSEAITDHACGAPIDEAAATHLAECARCQQLFEDRLRVLASVDEELRSALTIAASPDFSERVASRMLRGRPSPKVPAHWWIGAASAAAMVAVGVYVTSAMRPNGGPSGQSGAASPSTTAQPASVPMQPPSMTPAPRPASERAPGHLAASTTRASGAPSIVRNPNREPRTGNRGQRTADGGPEVIVPPDQRRAIARLTALLENGLLDAKTLPTQPATEELTVAPLSIPEIVVPDVHTVGGPVVAGGAEREMKE